MKINLLYLIIPVAIAAALYTLRDLQAQSEYVFFGTAESDQRSVTLDLNVWVEKVYVHTGSFVHTGDTLALMVHPEFERDDISFQLKVNEDNLVLKAQQQILEKELDLLDLQNKSDIQAIDAEIRNLKIKDSLDNVVRQVVYSKPMLNIQVQEKIAELIRKKSILQDVYVQKKVELKTRVDMNQMATYDRKKQKQTLNAFDQNKKIKLFVTAPIDGYVDNLSISPNMPVSAFKEYMSITPMKASVIVGFIHESTIVPFHINDSVDLVSSTRPDLKSKGVIISASPKLIELPLRLRKYVEIRAWGREVIVYLPYPNDFFIGEKVSISLTQG